MLRARRPALRRRGRPGGRGERALLGRLLHHIVRGEHDCRPVLERSRELAQAANEPLTLSYALRHLGIAAHQAEDLESARQLLEDSTALRRTLGFEAGVAANLVGLIWIAVAQQRHHDGRSLYEEAIVGGGSGRHRRPGASPRSIRRARERHRCHAT